MPRPANPAARGALIETAARLLADEGRAALTVRRLGRETGTSSMAVYTQFGGMDELHRAVRIEGFRRLGEYLATVPELDDPVAELAAVGYAYCANAIANPNLYRVMFLDAATHPDEWAAGAPTFERLVAAIERCLREGRFRPGDAQQISTRFWGVVHGFVTLELAGLLSVEESIAHLIAAATDLCAGLGDDPAAAARSVHNGHLLMAKR